MYGAGNLTDGTYRSWVEGAEGNGIGESFTVEFMLPVKLYGFYLRNGFGQLDHFYKNGRVKTFEIVLDDAASGELVHIEDEYIRGSYYFTSIFKTRDFIECSKVTFIIRDIYPGTEFTDTCISEILFTAPDLRFGEGWIENSPRDILNGFTADKYTVSLIKAMYEGYGLRTRLDGNGELEMYTEETFDINKGWYKPSVKLSGEVAHRYFSGTGAGQAGHRYKIFLSEDFPPLLIVYAWDTTSLTYFENRLYKIKLFNGTSWEDRDTEPAIVSILTLKEDIEARGLWCQFLFEDYEDDSGNIAFGNQNSLVLRAVETESNNVLEKIRFLWNGKKFELQ